MSSQRSVGEMNQLADGLDEAGFTSEMVTKLRHHDLLVQVKAVIMGLAQIVRLTMTLACEKAFDAVKFVGEGWSVVEADHDSRADKLTAVDWDHVSFDTHMEKDETTVLGKEKLTRAKKSGRIQLGTRQFLSLWEEYQASGENSVLERLRKSKNITVIYFFGDVLLDPGGYRCVSCLYFTGGRWYWSCRWLAYGWDSGNPSASLASV